METAAANDLSTEGRTGLRGVLDWHWNSFRLRIRGDSRARVEPLTVTFKPKGKAVKKTLERAYSPINILTALEIRAALPSQHRISTDTHKYDSAATRGVAIDQLD